MEKERKKAEKAKKFAEKKAKTATAPSAAPTASKTKEKKAKSDAAKDEPLPEYVEETPPGEKKSTQSLAGVMSESLLTAPQYSSHSTTSSTKHIFPRLSSQPGMHGGRRKASSSPNLVQMAR